MRALHQKTRTAIGAAASLLFLALLLTSKGNIAFAEENSDEPLETIDEVAREITASFPVVQGEVIGVEDGTVKISVGIQDGVREGLSFSIWRTGAEIRHPDTGAVLGKREEEVGSIEVTAVERKTSTGVLRRKNSQPAPGDRVRTTMRKVKIALLPDADADPVFHKALFERLVRTDRFSLIETGKTTAFLKERGAKPAEEQAAEIGKEFHLDGVVSEEMSRDGEKIKSTFRIYDVRENRLLRTITAAIKADSGKDMLGDVEPFFSPGKEQR